MIPTKITPAGDKAKALEYLGYAKKQLEILRRQVELSPALEEGHRTVSPVPGVIVECWTCYARSEIKITAFEGKKKVVEYPIEEEGEEECPCFPCFSLGIIRSIRTTPTTQEYRDGIRFSYDIAVCRGKVYTIFENYEVKASAWEEYYVGQYVAVSVDVMQYDDPPKPCCIDNFCLFQDLLNTEKLEPLCFQIFPIYFPGKMKRWLLK